MLEFKSRKIGSFVGCVDDHNNSVVNGISKPTTFRER